MAAAAVLLSHVMMFLYKLSELIMLACDGTFMTMFKEHGSQWDLQGAEDAFA
jgi:hypothetical protein